MRPTRSKAWWKVAAIPALLAGCFTGVFGDDYKPLHCTGDTDCGVGQRCLRDQTGSSCKSPDQTACATAACAPGTTCVDGTCRTVCEGAGALACLSGQACKGAVCVGNDPMRDPPAGGGGSGGSGGSGPGAAAGSGGMPGGAGDGGAGGNGGSAVGGEGGATGGTGGAGGTTGGSSGSTGAGGSGAAPSSVCPSQNWISCNPLLPQSCEGMTGTGSACDISLAGNAFNCYPMPNTLPVGTMSCGAASAPGCVAGATCVQPSAGIPYCRKYCCTTGDCAGSGSCVALKSVSKATAPVGVCVPLQASVTFDGVATATRGNTARMGSQGAAWAA